MRKSKDSVEDANKTFIDNIIWSNTFSSAFQRASVYSSLEGSDLSESEYNKRKDAFKTAVKKHVEVLLSDYEKGSISCEKHIQNIESIIVMSAQVNRELKILEGPLKFGPAQKILNLYLKFKWLACDGPIPPHFPIDRTVLEYLNKIDKNIEVYSWTKEMTRDKYEATLQRVAGSEKIAQFFKNNTQQKLFNLAELELMCYNDKG